MRAFEARPDLWTSGKLTVAIQAAPEEREKVMPLDRPFAVVRCDVDGRLHLSGGTGRQRVLYLHGTANGVYVATLLVSRNGRTGPRGNWLKPGDELQVRGARLRAWVEGTELGEAADETSGNLIARTLSPADASQLEIMLPSSTKGRIERRLRRRLAVLGRGPQALVRIDDPSVSLIHCVIYQQAGRLWVIDLESGAGTRVNGQLVPAAELFPGDLLQLGSVRLRTFGPVSAERADSPSAPLLAREEENAIHPYVQVDDVAVVASADRRPTGRAVEPNGAPNALQHQVDGVEARLEALDRQSTERDHKLRRLREALMDQKQSLDRLLAEFEQRDKPWEKRLGELQDELRSLRTANTAAFEEMGRRLETREGALRDFERGLAALEAAGRQQAEANRSTIEGIERCQAQLAETTHTAASLKEMHERIAMMPEPSEAGESNQQLRRLATLEESQRVITSRLEDTVRQITDLKNALVPLRADAESSLAQHTGHLSTLRSAIDDVKRELAAQAEQVKANQEWFHRLRSEQQETAKSARRMNQDLFARLTALEVFWQERSVAHGARDREIDTVEADPRETNALGSEDREEPPSPETIRRDATVLPEPIRPNDGGMADDDQGETTDRLLSRQMSLDAAKSGRWRRRLRWSVALTLAAAGAAAVLRHFGVWI